MASSQNIDFAQRVITVNGERMIPLAFYLDVTERDRDLIESMRDEINKLKCKVNQLEQRKCSK